MTEITSINQITGKKFNDSYLVEQIKLITDKYHDIQNIKLFFYEATTLLFGYSNPIKVIRVVFSMNEEYKVVDAIDNTIENMENELNQYFKNYERVLHWYIIWKKYN